MTQPTLIAGPCVIEPNDVLEEVARIISSINTSLGTDIILKASFDKANRTSINSYRGVGIDRGLQMLADIKSRYGLRITTDIHEAWQAEPVSEVADIVQIPALLSRQTDLIVAAARHAKVVNIKKGQMLSEPGDHSSPPAWPLGCGVESCERHCERAHRSLQR